jgi:hypothetical protein
MHVSALKALIDMCYLANLPIVNMNSSTSMFELLVFSNSNHILCFLSILIFVVLIDLQGIAFKLINPLAMISFFWNQTMMFMQRLSNPFWSRLNLKLSLA